MELTHMDKDGNARMVDVSEKEITHREAVASGKIYMDPETVSMILNGTIPKGDVFAVARVAGIMAAKKTQELIPMCHNILLDSVTVDFEHESETGAISIKATVKCTWKTGVEMEALTAVSIAALTIYDMCKAVDKGMRIGEIGLVKKTGGKSGVKTDAKTNGKSGKGSGKESGGKSGGV
jgi:cyclic pyranopterin phosphate synthase